MNKRYGVIDLGTNTFHILIVEATDNGLREVHRESRFIKLGEEGIETIGEAPFQRGLATLIDYKQALEAHNIEDAVALGTAALRTASNGRQFVEQVRAITGIEPRLISGQEEARLIHNGVRHAVPLTNETSLIMDIGGGSVEFIIANREGILWAESFPVGVAVLFREFHRHDPISSVDIEAIHRHLGQVLKPLHKELQQHKIKNLIGASGTFDVLEAVLVKDKEHPHYANLDAALFYPYYERIIATTFAERLQMTDLPATRADMIVVALVLIRHILEA
ncbi:MAG: phosphatase, partial [Bacteroidota bacterium]